MSNKAHLRPHRKKRQASRTTGLLLVILFLALVALATAMVASGHAMPAGRIIPLRGLPGPRGVWAAAPAVSTCHCLGGTRQDLPSTIAGNPHPELARLRRARAQL
jgi:hypothetical protein